MFAIIILALLPRALAQTKVITGIDCQIDSRNIDLLSETWDSTKFGEGGVNDRAVKNGDEGKLFQFDCQKRCYDSDNDMGKFWMTCGYTWKHIKDLLPEDEIVVDLRTEAYDNEGSCREEGYKKAMSLDATGGKAVDTAGQDGHYGFFLCYKTGLWKESFKKEIEYYSDLQARTEEYTTTTPPMADALPNKEKNKNDWKLIGQWETHNNGENFAYGDQRRTGGRMYLYTKRKTHAPVTLVGVWKSKTHTLKDWREKMTLTYSTTFTEASELSSEQKEHWESTMTSGHTISTSVSASGTYKGVDVEASAAYEYSTQYEENETIDKAVKEHVTKSLKADFTKEMEFTLPPRDDSESYTYIFYYFVVEAHSKDKFGNDVVTGFGPATSDEVFIKSNICDRELPPNCIPLQCEDEERCYNCKSPQAMIDPGFREPYYCEEGEGCDWVPITAKECELEFTESDLNRGRVGNKALKRCGPQNDHGQLCEGPQNNKLINGKNSEINNCYGDFDIFRFHCPRAPYAVTINSGSTSVELTVAVVGDDRAHLDVKIGEEESKFMINSIMEEGTRQFSDRKYTLSGVPDHLDGAMYWKGPCHSRGASFTVHTKGTVYLLASHGNSAVGSGRSPFVFEPKPQSTATISMRTTSFPSESKFEEWVIDRPVEVTLSAKLNTYSVLDASEDLAFYVLALLGLVAVLTFVRSALRKDEYKVVIDEASKLEELNEEI